MREEWSPAGFVDRLGADFLDSLIAIAVAFPAYLLVDRALLQNGAAFLDDEASSGVAELIIWGWFLWNLTYLVGKTGQSWGRKLSGLKVVTAEGDAIGFWRALGRNLFALFISGPVFYLGFLWVVWDPNKQAWHDKVFRTFVFRRVVL